MRTIYFGKHRNSEGNFYYTSVWMEAGRDSARSYLKQYNKKGARLIGCHKRVLSVDKHMQLIDNINCDDTLRREYFERRI